MTKGASYSLLQVKCRNRVTPTSAQVEHLGVITHVEEPAEWCAGMVEVPKSDGIIKVRICIDLIKAERKCML